MAKTRPIGVTILAVLALLGAVNAAIYTLQLLHILPTFIGPVAFYQFSLIGAFFWGILVLIWLAVFRMLMDVQPQGWTVHGDSWGLEPGLRLIAVLGGSSWQAMAPLLIVSGLVVIYCLLPGTKQAFGIPQ